MVLSDLLKYVDETEGQAWDDIIRVMTFANVGFDLFLKRLQSTEKSLSH